MLSMDKVSEFTKPVYKAGETTQIIGVEIVILHDVSQEKDVEQELAENRMSCIASFRGELYRMCSHKIRRREKE